MINKEWIVADDIVRIEVGILLLPPKILRTAQFVKNWVEKKYCTINGRGLWWYIYILAKVGGQGYSCWNHALPLKAIWSMLYILESRQHDGKHIESPRIRKKIQAQILKSHNH